RDRLRLGSRRAAARDRARGRRALPGDPRDRKEDGRAHRARAQGEDGSGCAARAGREPDRARRPRRARLFSARRRGRARARRPRPAGRGAGSARAEAGGMNTQFLAPVLAEGDEVEETLRPRRLADFVGQARVKEQLGIALEAAQQRGEALDHVLLVGPPGLGKTSLAYIVRPQLRVGLRTLASPEPTRKGDMAAILTGLEDRDVLFVDEIHRLNRAIEEILYPALEAFRLYIEPVQD